MRGTARRRPCWRSYKGCDYAKHCRRLGVTPAQGADTTAPSRLRIKAEFALFRLCRARHNRNNWLFAGSLRAGQRAAAVMSLIQSARMNGHDPYAYLSDVMARLPMQRASRIQDLLPHRWQPTTASNL